MPNRTERTLKEVSAILHKGEKVINVINQSLLTSLSPDGIVITNERLIVVHHSFWGYHIGINLIKPTEMHIVEYDKISSITISHGRVLSSIKIFIQGAIDMPSEEEGSWNLHSLWKAQAIDAMKTLQDLIESSKMQEAPKQALP